MDLIGLRERSLAAIFCVVNCRFVVIVINVVDPKNNSKGVPWPVLSGREKSIGRPPRTHTSTVRSFVRSFVRSAGKCNDNDDVDPFAPPPL